MWVLFLLSFSLLRVEPVEIEPHPSLSLLKIPVAELIIVSPSGNEELREEYGAQVVYVGKYADFEVWRVEDRDRVISSLKYKKSVLYAEPVTVKKLAWTPNDPYFSYQWHFDTLHINVEAAWDLVPGGRNDIKVGILDSGVAYEFYPIPPYEQNEVISSDGYYHPAPDLLSTHFSGGYDAVHQDDHPNDQNGHGTHVAGTIAQSTNNNYGVAGIAFNTTVVPVQIADKDGYVYSSWFLDGLAYLISEGVSVINMSFSGPDSSRIEHDLIKEAYNSGILLVAASGNTGLDVGYPARYPEVVAVGATALDDDIAPYSSRGYDLEVVAPGGNTSEDLNGDGYVDGVLQETYLHLNFGGEPVHVDSFVFYFLQGTSMAAPHVTGEALLLFSIGVNDPVTVRSYIRSGVVDLGVPGFDPVYGYGRIRVDSAIKLALGPSGPPDFDIWFVQNPYLTEYVDLWVVSDRALYGSDSPPDTVYLIKGDTVLLSMEKVSFRTYRSLFTLEEEGVYKVVVKGRSYSGIWGESEREFGFYRSQGRIAFGGIYIEPLTQENFYVLIYRGVPEGVPKGGSSSYSFGLNGAQVPFKISMNDPGFSPVVRYYVNGSYREAKMFKTGDLYETTIPLLTTFYIEKGEVERNRFYVTMGEAPTIYLELEGGESFEYRIYGVNGALYKKDKLYLTGGRLRIRINGSFPQGVYYIWAKIGDDVFIKKGIVIK